MSDGIAAGQERPPLFEMPSPFLLESGTLKLLEPPDSSSAKLAEALIDGEYGKPFVLEKDGLRSLHFSLCFIQSTMRIKDPDVLDLIYTQKMMSFLLFNPKPKRVLLIGLGGGSIAKFCYRRLPGAQMTVVELDPHVLAYRDEFLVPADTERFRIIEGDGAEYVANMDEKVDALLVDAFDENGVAPALADDTFFQNAYRRLSGKGILIMNIAGDRGDYGDHVDRLCAVFGDRVLAMSVKDGGNLIAFAFKDEKFEPRWTQLRSIAPEMQRRFGLDFPRFVQLLESGQKRRLVEKTRS